MTYNLQIYEIHQKKRYFICQSNNLERLQLIKQINLLLTNPHFKDVKLTISVSPHS